MKNFFIVSSVLLSSLIACENFGGTLNNTASDSAKADVIIFPRDMSITSSNSYSDLFLDSLALEKYIASHVQNDSLAIELRNFYNVRNYQYAWFNSEGLTEEGRGFWSLYDYMNDQGNSLQEDKTLAMKMDTLTEADTLMINATDSSFVKTEITLTGRFIKHSSVLKNQIGFENPYHFISTRKIDAMTLTDSILRIDSLHGRKDSLNRSDSQTHRSGRPYDLLKQQLQKYYQIAQKGSLPPIPRDIKKFSKGKSYTSVAALKKILLLTGDLKGSDTSVVFTDSLESAIISYKVRHGFDSSATLSDSLINDLNIPASQRIEQILVNMNRMKWVPDISANQVITVNIPEFMMRVYEGGAKALEMKVVVGKEGANTTMFSGNLNQVVFSPYWNVPASIVEEEILPAMNADPNYLQKHRMEIVKQNDSLPVIRQVPGPGNAMGKAKFLFPNSYDIFLHDTPAKDLFALDKRAFSHGCIRVEDAQKLAEYLLKDDKGWTSEKIQQAMNSSKEKFVSVEEPVPVVITYFTAWVDENGRLNFRDDIYGHDAKIREKMFGTANILQPTNTQDSTVNDTSRRRI